MSNCQKGAHIIAVANQKGGVGKTTTAVNLSAALAILNKNVLLVDFDPQGNTTTSVGVDKSNCTQNIYNALIEGVGISSITKDTSIPHLKVLPSNVDLSAAEIELDQIEDREFVLKQHLDMVRNEYDYIIIDCPPSLGLLTVNALSSSDSILIPVQCEFFSLEGLAHLLQTFRAIQRNFNKNLKINGVLLTMYDKRYRLTEQVETEVRSIMGEYVYQTVIPRNVRLSEAPSYALPGIVYDSNCSGSAAYIAFAKEFVEKNKKESSDEESGETSKKKRKVA